MTSGDILDADLFDGFTDHGLWTNKETGETLRVIEADGQDYGFSPVSEELRNGILAAFGKRSDGVTDLE